MSEQDKIILRFDNQGFLIGEKRLEEMSSGIQKTEDNTAKILKVLIEQYRGFIDNIQKNQPAASNEPRIDVTEDLKKSKVIENKDKIPLRRGSVFEVNHAKNNASSDAQAMDSIRDTRQRDKAIGDVAKGVVSNQKAIKAGTTAQVQVSEAVGQIADAVVTDPTSVKSRTQKARERDSKGRFVGGDGDGEGLDKSSASKLADAVNGLSSAVPDVGVDPTVDAIREVKDTIGPMAGIFSKMTSKAVALITGRRKKNATEETLPPEQVKANKAAEKSDKERNSLLRRVIDAILRGNSGLLGSGGLLGGLLGGKGNKGKTGGLGRGLLRKLPYVGALVGAGALAMNWGKSENSERGKGIGQVSGMVAGGALGSFLGPVGALGGAYLGQKLGGIFGEKVGEWTDDLKQINFGDLFKDTVKGVLSNSPVGMVIGGAKSAAGWVKDKVSTSGSSRADGRSSGAGYGTTATGSGKSAGSTKPPSNAKREQRQLMMYDALIKAGFSHNQALAIGGEIGRENDYSDIMFSTHIDPAKDKNGNSIKNGGVLSWNRGRYTRFQKHMQSKGLMDANGKMPETQETLDAQAEFIKWEMQNTHQDEGGRVFLGKPDADAKDAAVPLAKYIGWARGQPTIRGANGTRVAFDSKKHERKINGYIDKGEEMVAKRQSTNSNQSAAAAQKKTEKSPTTAAVQPAKKLTKPNNQPKRQVGTVKKQPITQPAKPATAQKQAVSKPQDASLPQNVSDRNLAHIYTGGIGGNLLG